MGAYVPLTKEQIAHFRAHGRVEGMPLSDALGILCNMAENCLLYAAEIQRLRDGDIEYPEFTKQFGPLKKLLGAEEADELVQTGYVAVAVGEKSPRRVFTLRIIANESEAKEFTFPSLMCTCGHAQGHHTVVAPQDVYGCTQCGCQAFSPR